MQNKEIKQQIEQIQLVEAIKATYEMLVSANLSKNTYEMLEYKPVGVIEHAHEGYLDELVSEGRSMVHPDCRDEFGRVFSSKSLMERLKSGTKEFSYVYRQMGNDQIYHWKNTKTVFINNPFGDDTLVMFMTNQIDESTADKFHGAVYGDDAPVEQASKHLLEETTFGGIIGGYDEQDYPFYYINRRMLDYLGYETEKSFMDTNEGLNIHCVHPKDRKDFRKKVEEQLQGNLESILEFRLQKRDGSYIWVHGNAKRMLTKEKKQVVLIACFDITNQKTETMRLDTFVQKIASGLVVCEVYPDMEYKVEYLNDGFAEIYEGTTEGLLEQYKRSPFIGMRKEDIPMARRILKDALENNMKVSETFRCVTQEGNFKWVKIYFDCMSERNNVVTAYVTYQDVTEQMEIQEQLNNIIQNVPGGGVCLYKWSENKLKPILVNSRAEEFKGEDFQHFIGEIDYKNVHPEDLSKVQLSIHKAIQEDGVFEVTYRQKHRKSGIYIWLHIRGTVVPQEDGTKLLYIGYNDVTDAKEKEAELIESRQFLEKATDHVRLWYWIYDMEKDRIYLSERAQKEYNIPAAIDNDPEKLLENSVILPLYRALYWAMTRKMRNGEKQVSFEAQCLIQGKVHWVRFQFTAVEDAYGQSKKAICTAQLVDEIKELEAQYHLEREKTIAGQKNLVAFGLFNLSNGGVTVEHTTEDGEEVLKPGDSTLFFERELIREDIVDSEKREDFCKIHDCDYLLEQYKRGIVEMSVEYRRKVEKGKFIWVRNSLHLVRDPNSNDILLFDYCYNINEEKTIREIMAAAIEYEYESMACINFESKRIALFFGKENKKKNGEFSYDGVMHRYASHMVHPDDVDLFKKNASLKNLQERLEKNDLYSFTYRVKGNGKNVKTRRINYAYYDRTNHLCLMIHADVTDLLATEKAQKESLHQALQIANQANQAKREFLTAMSHDIRTPLNAIVGMTELALNNSKDEKQVEDSLETIKTSSRHLSMIIDDILDMSKIESGKIVRDGRLFHHENDLQDMFARRQQNAREKGVRLSITQHLSHKESIGDIVSLGNVLGNILDNAIKFTPAEGEVIFAETELPSDKEKFGLYCFEIEDTGCGIPREQLGHIFEPFYRIGNAATGDLEGTGLGLSIAKGIVENMGGTIEVRSTVGAGAIFTVKLYFRLPELKQLVKAKPQKAADNIDISGLKVLLVEDHPINVKVATKLLEYKQVEVTQAKNGLEGYDIFKDSKDGEFDCILMDIQMPVMNGYESAKAIRECNHPQAKTVPIIAVTANAFAEDVKKSIDVGMNGHIAKPLEPTKLYRMLNIVKLKKNKTQ